MPSGNIRFHIADEVRALGVHGAYAVIDGVRNDTRAPGLDAWREDLAARLAAELAPGFIERDPVLRGFRELHDAVGRSNRRFPASAEALVSLFLRKAVIPRISPLVDIYNGVSLETRLSLGAHDLARLGADITLRMTDGSERFVPLGASGPEPVGPGEYGYVMGENEVICRLECRQCEGTRVTADTTACFYILQGNRSTGPAMLEAALDHLVELTGRFCGGRLVHRWLA